MVASWFVRAMQSLSALDRLMEVYIYEEFAPFGMQLQLN